MKKLLAFLNGLSPQAQADFARRCGTTVGYLRKAISKGQKIGESICIAIERESGRVVICEDIREDVDWAFLRGTPDPRRVHFTALPPVVRTRVLAGDLPRVDEAAG